LATAAYVPVHFLFFHILADLFDILVLVAVENLWSHDFSNWSQPRIATLGDRSNRDISISNRSNEPVILTDRQEPNIPIAHFISRLCNWRVGIDTFDIPGHNLVHFHD